MSDKELPAGSAKRLPDVETSVIIAKRAEFLAAIRHGLRNIETGETYSHEEIKAQLAQ